MQTLCVSWLEAELLFWVCSFLASESTGSNVCGEVEGAPPPPPTPPPPPPSPEEMLFIYQIRGSLACGGGQEGMRRTTQPKLFLLVNVFVFRFGKEEVVVSHGAPPPLAALHTTIPISPTRTPPPVEGPKSCCNSGTDANQLARLQR